MKLSKAVANLFFIGAVCACAGNSEINSTIFSEPVKIKETEVFLQEPYTRIIARCSASAEDAAFACAEKFEQKGYVRLKNIPYKTARYDF